MSFCRGKTFFSLWSLICCILFHQPRTYGRSSLEPVLRPLERCSAYWLSQTNIVLVSFWFFWSKFLDVLEWVAISFSECKFTECRWTQQVSYCSLTDACIQQHICCELGCSLESSLTRYASGWRWLVQWLALCVMNYQRSIEYFSSPGIVICLCIIIIVR